MLKEWEHDLEAYDKLNSEKKFLDMVQESGYTIEGFRPYSSKTVYLISKDGYSCEYGVYHVKGVSSKTLFVQFETLFNLERMTANS